MTPDLQTQLLEYGRDHRARQRPVDIAGITEQDPTTLVIDDAGGDDGPGPGPRRLTWMAAAAAGCLLVGGLVLLQRTDSPEDSPFGPTPATNTVVSTSPPATTPDSGSVPTPAPTVTAPTTTAAVPSTTLVPSTAPPDLRVEFVPPTGGLLAPGSWSVAATFSAPDVNPDQLASAADELRTWLGVVDVATAPDANAWSALTGLDADLCATDEVTAPCRPGIVAQVAGLEETTDAALRLGTDLGMNATTARDIPAAFIDGYVATALTYGAPSPRFDTATLGLEMPLTGPVRDDDQEAGSICDNETCAMRVALDTGGVLVSAGLEVLIDETGSEIIFETESGGTGVDLEDFLVRSDGTGGVLYAEGDVGGRRVLALGWLPLDTSLVAHELADGTAVWQHPVAGIALFLDNPGSATSPGSPQPDMLTLTAFDAEGNEIVRVVRTSDGPDVVDVRVQNVLGQR